MSSPSPEPVYPNGNSRSGNGQRASAAITPELVREIAERVYNLFLRDLKIERERQQFLLGQNRFRKGGR